MTRNEILTVAQFNKTSVNYKRFNYCQAWVSEEIFCSAVGSTFKLIKSYETIVGVVDLDNRILYELGKWSRTTSKHVSQINNQLFRGFTRELLQLTIEERYRL